MRKTIAVLIAALSAGACSSLSAKTETVTGTVIDLYCYSRNKQDVGMDHRDGRECARACIKWEGQPVGLLTTDGKVYQLMGPIVAGNNAKVAPHLTHTVSVTGEVADLDGMMTITTSTLTMASN